MKLVLHNYFIISEECFLEQFGTTQNHALNILGLYCVTARKDDDLESVGRSLESPQKYYGCDITDRYSLTRPGVASRGPRKSIKLDSLWCLSSSIMPHGLSFIRKIDVL